MTASDVDTQVEGDAADVAGVRTRTWRIRRSSLDTHVGVALTLGVLIVLICLPGYTLFGIALPGFGTSSQMRTVVQILTLLSLAQMWNLLAGFGGMISIGQQAFIGIGAYSVLVFADDWGIDPFLTLPLAGLIAAALSVPVAFVAFRLRGGYFAIATWVIAEVFFLLVLNNTALGGGVGRTIGSVGSYDRFTRENYTYTLALLVGFGAIAIVVLVLRSRLGLSLRAIRDSEEGGPRRRCQRVPGQTHRLGHRRGVDGTDRGADLRGPDQGSTHGGVQRAMVCPHHLHLRRRRHGLDDGSDYRNGRVLGAA